MVLNIEYACMPHVFHVPQILTITVPIVTCVTYNFYSTDNVSKFTNKFEVDE